LGLGAGRAAESGAEAAGVGAWGGGLGFAAGALGGAPGAEVGGGEGVEAELAVEELGEVVAHAQAVVLGGGLVVPLLDPGDELEEAGEHGEQALARPALAGLAIHVQVGEGLGPLQVIPAGPAVHRLAVVVRLAARVADEALLGTSSLPRRRK
jgi:hypothetical protein